MVKVYSQHLSVTHRFVTSLRVKLKKKFLDIFRNKPLLKHPPDCLGKMQV